MVETTVQLLIVVYVDLFRSQFSDFHNVVIMIAVILLTIKLIEENVTKKENIYLIFIFIARDNY